MARLVDAEVEACSAGSVTRVSGVCEQRRGARERGCRSCEPDYGKRERGTATVMAVALTACALVLMGAVGFAGRSALIKAHAEGTADLAALGAADAVRGKVPGEPCKVAKEMVEREGLDMADCVARTDLGTAKVEVKAKMPKPLKAIKVTAVAGNPQGY
ncbi:hypothetical protein QP572_02130 [Brevibacterium sp. UMB10442]|nr:hypothetical protein [Brevibacterium sp. UMB10442]